MQSYEMYLTERREAALVRGPEVSAESCRRCRTFREANELVRRSRLGGFNGLSTVCAPDVATVGVRCRGSQCGRNG
jgi:hypothetical protein